MIRTHQEQHFFFQEQVRCGVCSGSGEVSPANCEKCKGAGRYITTHEIELDLKVGSVLSGIMLDHLGNQENQSEAPGPLIVEIIPETHPDYEFGNNHNLLYKHCVDPVQAMLGDTIEIPLPEGGFLTQTLKRGCPEGHIEEVKGRGLPKNNKDDRGSLFVKIVYHMPDELTGEQEKALKAYLSASKKPKNKKRR